MQAGMNALMVLVSNSPAAQGGTNAATSGDEDGLAKQFAQLLNDSGAQADGQGTQQFTRGQLQANATTNMLMAQDISPQQADDQLSQLLQSAEQVVTPDKAGDVMAKIDVLLSKGADKNLTLALNQLKDQLQAIKDSGAPKTVAQILSAAPAMKEAALPLSVMVGMLGKEQKPVAAQPNESEETPAQAIAALLTLPSTMFHANSAEDKAAADAARKDAEKEEALTDTVTVLQPLAYMTMMPVATAGASDTANIAAITPRADLDQAVPPLELSASKSLPAVDLPAVNLSGGKAESAAATHAAAANAAAQATTDKLASAQELSSMVASTKEAKPIEISGQNMLDQKDVQSITSMLNPSHANGHTPTQTMSAAQPISVIPTHGYINHAPVTDQVHVAIKQASDDGLDKITIQLDPVDLGRVEVHMTRSHDGQTQISFTVDKAETFDSLSRDARSLERSLQEAGIKADTGSMQFNMRQQQPPQLQSGMNGQGQQNSQPQQNEQQSDASAATNIAPLASLTRNYMINIREGVDISA